MKYRSIIFSIVLLSSLIFVSDSVNAGTTPITGWAWSSNVGWISFSSENPGAFTGSGTKHEYGVKISTTTNTDQYATFIGHAWSSNIGWISFEAGDVADCPASVPVISDCVGKMNLTTGAVTGWGRILSLAPNGGWVELSGDKHPTVATVGGGTFCPDPLMKIAGSQPCTSGLIYNPTSGGLTGMVFGEIIGWLAFDANAGAAAQGNILPVGGSCSINTAMPLPYTGGQINIKLTAPIGGIGDYRFTIYTKNGSSESPNVFISPGNTRDQAVSSPYPQNNTPNEINYSPYPYVIFRDSVNHSTGQISCRAVTVSGKNNNSESTVLKVTKSKAIAGSDLVKVKVGSPVYLYWTVSSAPTACFARYIDPNNKTILEGWKGVVESENLTYNSNQNAYTVNGLDLGNYTVAMSCNNGIGQMGATSTARIEVKSTSWSEI